MGVRVYISDGGRAEYDGVPGRKMELVVADAPPDLKYLEWTRGNPEKGPRYGGTGQVHRILPKQRGQRSVSVGELFPRVLVGPAPEYPEGVMNYAVALSGSLPGTGYLGAFRASSGFLDLREAAVRPDWAEYFGVWMGDDECFFLTEGAGGCHVVAAWERKFREVQADYSGILMQVPADLEEDIEDWCVKNPGKYVRVPFLDPGTVSVPVPFLASSAVGSNGSDYSGLFSPSGGGAGVSPFVQGLAAVQAEPGGSMGEILGGIPNGGEDEVHEESPAGRPQESLPVPEFFGELSPVPATESEEEVEVEEVEEEGPVDAASPTIGGFGDDMRALRLQPPEMRVDFEAMKRAVRRLRERGVIEGELVNNKTGAVTLLAPAGISELELWRALAQATFPGAAVGRLRFEE